MAAAGDVALDVNQQVRQALQAGAFDHLAPLLDDLELQVTEPFLPSTWPWAVHLLAHIYALRLEDARFVWRRVPEEQRKNPELQAALALLQALWNKDYEGTWVALQSPAWSPPVAPLAAAVGEVVRARVLGVLRRAYSALTPSRAAALLGLPEPEAIAFALGAGWQQASASGLLSGGAAQAQVLLPSQAEHLERLSRYMMHVEAEPEPEADSADPWANP